jgi:hypothetical protein
MLHNSILLQSIFIGCGWAESCSRNNRSHCQKRRMANTNLVRANAYIQAVTAITEQLHTQAGTSFHPAPTTGFAEHADVELTKLCSVSEQR